MSSQNSQGRLNFTGPVPTSRTLGLSALRAGASSLELESSSLEPTWVHGEWGSSSLPFGSTVFSTRKLLICFVHSHVQVLAVL